MVLLALAASLAVAHAADQPRTPARALLASATTWAYQLQNVEARPLARTTFDVLVLDAGSGDGRWGLSASEIARLKKRPDGGRRLVLAYMNIGEAEDYRYYWKPAWKKTPPDWMGSANCRWKGDHRVQHWSREWQAILFGSPQSYLGRLMRLGYDGVYLDRVDIFNHWQAARPQAMAEMVGLVAALSAWSKARNADFLVVPQNGEVLLTDPRYLASIDGLGKEDMLFGDRGNEVANDSARVAKAEQHIALLLAAGLPVLAIEYARTPANVAAARERLSALGYTPYFGPRSLAYIGQDGPAHAEDGDTESVTATTNPQSGCQ